MKSMQNKQKFEYRYSNSVRTNILRFFAWVPLGTNKSVCFPSKSGNYNLRAAKNPCIQLKKKIQRFPATVCL